MWCIGCVISSSPLIMGRNLLILKVLLLKSIGDKLLIGLKT